MPYEHAVMWYVAVIAALLFLSVLKYEEFIGIIGDMRADIAELCSGGRVTD